MLPWTVCDGRNLAGRLWLSYRRSGEEAIMLSYSSINKISKVKEMPSRRVDSPGSAGPQLEPKHDSRRGLCAMSHSIGIEGSEAEVRGFVHEAAIFSSQREVLA